MFIKHDMRFEETAADPIRRAAAIADLSNRRTIMFWCACVVSLATIVSVFGSKSAGGVIGFCAAIQWMLVFKCESELRMLRVIARLQRDERTLA